MARYAALLRGVTPMNAKMPELKRAFEWAGFTEVKTVLASGNVVFNARGSSSPGALERKAEAAMQRRLGSAFLTIVRSLDALQELLDSDPYRRFRIDPTAKRVVTFLKGKPRANPPLPIEFEGARILHLDHTEAFTVYVRHPAGRPVFMTLIEKTFGTVQTTRTWDTVGKIVRA